MSWRSQQNKPDEEEEVGKAGRDAEMERTGWVKEWRRLGVERWGSGLWGSGLSELHQLDPPERRQWNEEGAAHFTVSEGEAEGKV